MDKDETQAEQINLDPESQETNAADQNNGQ